MDEVSDGSARVSVLLSKPKPECALQRKGSGCCMELWLLDLVGFAYQETVLSGSMAMIGFSSRLCSLNCNNSCTVWLQTCRIIFCMQWWVDSCQWSAMSPGLESF